MAFQDPRGRPTLSIAEYDQREAAARLRASYPALRSFAPVTFGQVNFPTRVTEEAELRRYADIMYEIANREHWMTVERWSAAERDLILRLRREIENLTAALFERPVEPFMCLFPPMPIVRMIEAVAQASGRRALNVLEIGPGSGFLAAYLILRGHRYAGVDNTQALYLWQHRLLQWLTQGRLRDTVFEERPPAAPSIAPATLIPWWHFAEMFRTPGFAADVVVCDAAIGEMDPFGARYVIRIAKGFLDGSPVGTFIYQNLGEQRHNRADTVDHLFANVNGYRSFSCGPVRVHCANATLPDAIFHQMAEGPPRVSETARETPLAAESFMSPSPDKIMESYSFFDYLRLDKG